MDRGAWLAIVHRAAELNMTEHNSTQLSVSKVDVFSLDPIASIY